MLRSLPFLLILSILAACIETDIAIPSFPSMMEYFQTVESTIQLTLSINFIGLCISGLFYGPLSDSFGRRPVLLMGSAIFLIGAIGSACAPTLPFLIGMRLLQGIGAGGAFTIAFAMVADVYQGERAGQLINTMNGVVTAAMAAAPMLGAFLQAQFGWRSAYTFVALFTLCTSTLCLFFLPETRKEKTPFHLKKIVKDYQILLKSGPFLTLCFIPNFACGAYMAFVSCAVFYYVDTLGLTVGQFSFHQGTVIASFSVVSFLSGTISKYLGNRRAILSGGTAIAVGTSAMLALSVFHVFVPIFYTLAMTVFGIGVAFVFGPAYQASMEIFPEIRGAASAMNMSIRLLVVSLAIWFAGVLYNGMFTLPSLLIWTMGMGATALIISAYRQPKTRELLV